MKTTASIKRVELMFRAFSDRTRLRLLNLLSRGELCVCDLVEVLDIPQPKASRHLAYLRKAGLVLARKDGYWSYYQLAPAKNDLHTKLLECLACCVIEDPGLAKDSKALQLRLGKGCCS